MLVRALVLSILAALASVPTAARAAAPRSQESAEALLAEVRRKRDGVDPRIFERLALIGTEEALKALEEATGALSQRAILEPAFAAFEHFRGKGELERAAIEFVAGEAGSGKEPVRRAAARGLARFGEAARPELERLLARSKDDLVRAFALGPLVPGLVREGTPEALETILANARVGPSGTRAALEEALASFDGEKAQEVFADALASKKTPDLVRVLVIEVLAPRERPGIVDALRKALRAKSPAVQYAALAALTDRGERAHLPELKRLLRSKDAAVRRLAVLSLARIEGADPAWYRELEALSRDKDPAARAGAAAALGELRTPAALERLYAMLADPDRSVRAEVLQAVGNLRRKDSIPHLIARVNAETGRMKIDVLTVLRLITGEDLGTSYERWKRWWDAEGEAFRVPEYVEAERKERERRAKAAQGRTVTSFYGLEVVSDRVCFVLDTSGSMQAETPSGKTRMEIAREELSQVLRRYPEGELFNIVFFATDVMPWQDELVEMSAKTREEALAYVARQQAEGYTAVYDALALAFEDERVDTIYLLTDGVPMHGTIDDPEEIRAEVRRWNSARHLRIHGISIGGHSPLHQALAADSGGDYRVVTEGR